MEPTDSPIDPKEINITITELDPPDYKVDFEIPQRLVKRISKKLKKGGLNYNDQQMTALLVKICVDEGIFRLDKETVWGMMPMKDTPPPKYSIDKPFTFTSITDVFSSDDLIPLEGIEIKRMSLEITDELVNREIESQKLECGTRTPHKGTLQIGDEITGSISLVIDGETEPLIAIDNVTIQIQEPENITIIGNLPYLGLNEQLVDTTPKSSINISTEVPLPYHQVEKRGMKATLQLQIDAIERITPASIEEVLQQYGIPNETILQMQVKTSLQRNFNRENKLVMLNQLYEHLDKQIDIPLSQRIIQARFTRQCQSITQQPDASDLSDEDKDELLSQTYKFIKRQALTSRLRKQLDVKIGEMDIEAQIRDIAERRRQRPEDVKSEYIAENKMGMISNICAEFKILEALEDHITFIDA